MFEENKKVKETTKKALFKAIEKLNRPMDQIDFNAIYDSNLEMFGARGRRGGGTFNNLSPTSSDVQQGRT